MFGELGLGDCQNRLIPTQIYNLKAKQISASHNYTLLIDLENSIWCFGDNDFGKLGLGNYKIRSKTRAVPIPRQILNMKASQIATGYAHTIIIATLII